MKNCGVLLASPRSPRAEAAPLKGSLVSVRVRPGALLSLVCPFTGGTPATTVPGRGSPLRQRLAAVPGHYPLHVQMVLHCGANHRRKSNDLEKSRRRDQLRDRCAGGGNAANRRPGAYRPPPSAEGPRPGGGWPGDRLCQPLIVGPAREIVRRMMTRRSRTIAAR